MDSARCRASASRQGVVTAVSDSPTPEADMLRSGFAFHVLRRVLGDISQRQDPVYVPVVVEDRQPPKLKGPHCLST
jgi:hypothetical protein